MIIKQAILTRASRRADKSVSISFTTSLEQSTSEMAELDGLFQQDWVLAIKPSETPFLDSEIADLDSIDVDLEDTTKTPSKRLRSVLYILWDQGVKDVEFKEFYKNRMERLIEQIKNRLTWRTYQKQLSRWWKPLKGWKRIAM